MFKKNDFILFIAFITFLNLNAQVRIGDFQISKYAFSKVSKKQIDEFKKSKTFFVVDEKLQITKAQFEEILGDVWTITPFEVIEEKNLKENMKEENSFFRYNSFLVTTTGRNVTSTKAFIVFDLFMPKNIKFKKKNRFKWKPNRLAAIYFVPDIAARKEIVLQNKKVYGDLLNYRIGYIKNYFEYINNKLLNYESFEFYDDHELKNQLRKLKKNKLYFSKDFIYGYNAFSIDEKKSYLPEELFKEYKFDYEVIPSSVLNDKILNNKGEDFFYLSYSQINPNKIVSIVNGKNGEIIYSRHTKISFNLKPKDLRFISKMLSKL
ncbi:hypothetical protein [Olleya sp. Bg11-27]|uniref:hypothetical protein n=1 Tax=Olleya sp. Bg11-27 TaxID=2058135 RepID=UPI000C30FEC1|nr:hypothetical protein [Olleya sp. Bg11-27]AUC76623.1 hypothetical protein CW732_13465 [Olleya sp. Bg11-27]